MQAFGLVRTLKNTKSNVPETESVSDGKLAGILFFFPSLENRRFSYGTLQVRSSEIGAFNDY